MRFRTTDLAMTEATRRTDGGDPAENASGIKPGRRSREEQLDWVLEQVRLALLQTRFGQVVVTVQDGVAIQIERTEKTRLR